MYSEGKKIINKSICTSLFMHLYLHPLLTSLDPKKKHTQCIYVTIYDLEITLKK